MTGIFTGCALPGLVATFFSSRQGSLAAVASIWGGFLSAVITWLTLANRFSGEVTIASVGAVDPCLYGCIAGIGGAAVITILISLFHNARYQWDTLRAVRLVDDDGKERDVTFNDPHYDAARLRKAAYLARGVTLVLFLAIFIIWPLSMYGSGYIFSRQFFTGWVIVSLLWTFGAIFAVTLFPLIEGRHTLGAFIKEFIGRKRVEEQPGKFSGASTPSSVEEKDIDGSIEYVQEK
jgi:urea-proton symporter